MASLSFGIWKFSIRLAFLIAAGVERDAFCDWLRTTAYITRGSSGSEKTVAIKRMIIPGIIIAYMFLVWVQALIQM